MVNAHESNCLFIWNNIIDYISMWKIWKKFCFFDKILKKNPHISFIGSINQWEKPSIDIESFEKIKNKIEPYSAHQREGMAYKQALRGKHKRQQRWIKLVTNVIH